MDLRETVIPVVYLAAAVLLIFGLKQQQRVRTAREGNIMAAQGMLLAVMGTLAELQSAGQVDYTWILGGLLLGGAIGAIAALKVEMTAMPEMVALFNGSGGAASALVALSFYWSRVVEPSAAPDEATIAQLLAGDTGGLETVITLCLSVLIGAVTFSGSVIAFLKLRGSLKKGAPILLPGRHVINVGLIVAAFTLMGWLTFLAAAGPQASEGLLALTGASLLLGVLLVIPIGGADMPVVVSLLNSYSGLAASMAGFVIASPLLIIGGAMVGAAGLILTHIMCKAMNRSLMNVLVGGFGQTESGGGASEYENVTSAGSEEAALVLESAESVVIVPGYGLAVAQAQHACRELGDLMEKRGATVRYGIHPVAGRMPGHMNVLLAEADVPYEKLVEMDEINPDFNHTDVVIVLGANDVVNPAALDEESSPIYGMPILEVHHARTVLVVKRSLSPGYAGIKNGLFEHENTLMVFGDAKKVLQELTRELKEL